MHRATRALIADRLRDAGAVLTVSSVRRVPQFEPTNCLPNSAKAMSIDVLGSGSTNNPCVAGWVVTAFDPKRGHAPIVQHWWNRDPILGVEFDTTPLHPDTIAVITHPLFDDADGLGSDRV